jgi:Mannose-6-phosphate isomerase
MEYTSHDPGADVEAVPGVHLSRLAAGEHMSVQHFTVEPGTTVPEHSHHHEQAGFIYEGTLTFVLADGSEVAVTAGDSYDLAGEEVHGAVNRGDVPVKGVDVFSPPRTDPDWAEE